MAGLAWRLLLLLLMCPSILGDISKAQFIKQLSSATFDVRARFEKVPAELVDLLRDLYSRTTAAVRNGVRRVVEEWSCTRQEGSQTTQLCWEKTTTRLQKAVDLQSFYTVWLKKNDGYCSNYSYPVNAVSELGESTEWQDRVLAAAADLLAPHTDTLPPPSHETLEGVLKYVFGISNETSFDVLIREIEENVALNSVTLSIMFGMLSSVSALVVIAYIVYIRKKKTTVQTARTVSYVSSEKWVTIPSLHKDRSLQIFLLKIAIVMISIVILACIVVSIVCLSSFFQTHNKITASLPANINNQLKNIYNEMYEFMCSIRNSVENPQANMIASLNDFVSLQLEAVNAKVLSETHHHELANKLVNHFESLQTRNILVEIDEQLPEDIKSNHIVMKAVNKTRAFFDSFYGYTTKAQSDNKSIYNVHNILDYNKELFSEELRKTKFTRPINMFSKAILNELYNIDSEITQFKRRNLEKHYTITNSSAKDMIVAIMVVQLASCLLTIALYFAPLNPKVILTCSVVVFLLMIIPSTYTPMILRFANVRQFGCDHFDRNRHHIWNTTASLNGTFLHRNYLNVHECYQSSGHVFFEKYTDRSLQGFRDKISKASDVIRAMSIKHASNILPKLMNLKSHYIAFDQRVNATIRTCTLKATQKIEESIECFDVENDDKIVDELLLLTLTIKRFKTSLMNALPADCQMTLIYSNIVNRVCNQIKPFYLVALTLYLYNGCLWLIGVAVALIGRLRFLQPVRLRSEAESKRKLNANNQKKFGNSVGIALDCIGIDPRKAYKEFLRPLVTDKSKEKISGSKVSTSNMSDVKESKEATDDLTVVDLGWPGERNQFNGNWVVPIGQAHKYIMAAAPTADTAVDFWHVVFRYNCKAIVMLCEFVEKEKGQSVEKCFEYWNEQSPRVFKNQYAKYKIKCTSVKKSVIKNVKHLVFSVSNGYVTKKVELIQYTGWQDCLAPENPEEMALVMKTIYEEIGHTDEPVVVHCADGLGRSAAFVGMDVLLGMVDSDPNPGSFDLIQMMRQFRANSYTDKWQYYFTYICFFQFHILNFTYGEVSKIYNYIKDRKISFVDKMKCASTAEDYTALRKRRVQTAMNYIEFQNTNDKKGKKNKESSSQKERKLSGTYLKGCDDEYLLGKVLGSGTYGEVYQATKEKQDSKMNPPTKEYENEVKYAIKTEKLGITCSSLTTEIYVLMDVSTNAPENRNQIVQYIDKGRTANFDFLVMNMVGKSLSTIQQHVSKKLNSFSAMYISIQSFNAVHQLHRCGFIHRDIKPGNFAIGGKKNEKVVFILDFGMAQRSIDRNGNVAVYSGKEKGFVGTMRYAPRAAHKMKKQNLYDDIESWLYMSIEMFQKLPWKGNVNSAEVLQGKSNLMKGNYWQSMWNNGLPIAMLHIIKMIYEMNPAEAPDYRKLMHAMMGAECDCDVDLNWIISKKIHDKEQYESQATRATSRDKKAILASFASLGRF